MKTKFNFLKTKKQIMYSLGMAIIAMALIVGGCTKDAELINSASPDNNQSRMTQGKFISINGTANQTFTISCTCAGSFTLTNSLPFLYYGALNPSVTPVNMTGYSATLNKLQYYYVIPSGGSSTNCLKVMFINDAIRPTFSYNSSTNTWSNLQNNSSINASQVSKSSVPECTPC